MADVNDRKPPLAVLGRDGNMIRIGPVVQTTPPEPPAAPALVRAA